MTSIEITDVTGLSYPYTIYVCDVFGNQCLLLATINAPLPPSQTFILPTQFNTAPAVGIKLISHDCGELDDKSWVDGYVYDTWDKTKVEEAKERNKQFEIHSIAVKGKLKQLYGCNVYSLNPFINYNLEGVNLTRNGFSSVLIHSPCFFFQIYRIVI